MTDLPARLRTDAAGLDRLAARYRSTGIDRDGAELGERAGLMRAAADEIERLRGMALPAVARHGHPDSDPSRMPDWYDTARQTNAALTLKGGIHEADVGFDCILSLNDVGLKVLRRALERAFMEGQEHARASAVDEVEAPDLEVTEQICLDKLKQERDAYKDALRPFAREAERIAREWPSMTGPDVQWQIKFRHLDRARALLSQSSEGK
jgi:hypothetical protein